MRAGPLSNPEIIQILNQHFVSVYAVNEDYRASGTKKPEEVQEYQRVFQEAAAAGLSTGTVHAYILDPDGRVIDSMHVANAAKKKEFKDLLTRSIRKLNVAPGDPVVQVSPQSRPPEMVAGSVRLHLVARSVDGRGAWSEFPAENWLALTAEEQQKFAPSQPEKGHTWTIPGVLSAKLFRYFYPATENNEVTTNELLDQKLSATVASVTGSVAVIHLQGSMRMKHSFYQKPDDKLVEASVVGIFEIDLAKQKLRSFRMVTDSASYNQGRFAVALRSID